MGAGRPTDYKPEYCEQATKLCKLGATDKELADFFEICEATLTNWKRDYPEFLASIREGKEIADMEVSNRLFVGCFDRTIVEQQAFKTKNISYNEDGKRIETETVEVVDVERGIPGDFRNQQFWLRNRRSQNWREKIETEHSGSISNPAADVLAKLSDQALKELRDAQNTDPK